MRKSKIFFVFLLISIFVAGCSANNTDLATENTTLKEQIKELESDNGQLKGQVIQLRKELEENKYDLPVITYSTYEYKKRYVPMDIKVLWFPLSNAPEVTMIPGNSVITVIDAGLSEKEGQELWLYVEAPVYDSPMNYKGWIRESDTVELTKENQMNVQSDVKVKKGTPFYETYSFDSIATTKAQNLPYDAVGRITGKKDGMVRLNCPGGWDFWVSEKNIEYPPVQ